MEQACNNERTTCPENCDADGTDVNYECKRNGNRACGEMLKVNNKDSKTVSWIYFK